MNYIQVLQNASKYTQALYQDGTLYWSGDETLATPERKAILKSDLQLIKDQLTVLDGALSISK